MNKRSLFFSTEEWPVVVLCDAKHLRFKQAFNYYHCCLLFSFSLLIYSYKKKKKKKAE